METARQPSFSSIALASGLVGQADLDQAVAALRSAKTAKGAAIDDRRLAAKLVELKKLNHYQAAQLLAGRSRMHLGKYRITGSIGQGGMGHVFEAEHSILGRVAVKVLPRSKSTPESIASFTREIQAHAQLDHPNLVRAFDAGHDGNVYFLVTEFVPGTDLRKLVRNRGALSMNEAATIISQAAKGLEHAHTSGLIHRDVKPGNLLVTPDGHTKVSDLGLAGSLENPESDPRAGKVVGTADYLSPEQILTPRKVTPASDIYSLGCTLYYAVTGKVPFAGGTTREKARRHCEEAPLKPRRLNPALSEEFVEVIAAMMEKQSQNRIQTAREVIERLAPWAQKAVRPLTESDRAPELEPPTPTDFSSPDALLPDVSDTQDSLADFVSSAPDEQHSPSPASQSTDTVVAIEHETLPITADREHKHSQRGDAPSLLFILAPIGLIAALAVAGFVIWQMTH